MATLAADARDGGGFDAPVCHRDHCAANILTVERLVGETIDDVEGTHDTLAGRVTGAWLRQALSGRVVPYDFGPRDIMLVGERLVLTAASYEPQVTTEHARFAAYLDPMARKAQDRFVHSMEQRFSRVPFLVWDLINEPSANENAWKTLPQHDPFEEAAWRKWLRSTN